MRYCVSCYQWFSIHSWIDCDVDMNVSVSSWWFMSRNFVSWESSAENKQSVPFGSSKEFFLFARSTKMKRWHQTASGSNSYELPV